MIKLYIECDKETFEKVQITLISQGYTWCDSDKDIIPWNEYKWIVVHHDMRKFTLSRFTITSKSQKLSDEISIVTAKVWLRQIHNKIIKEKLQSLNR